MILTRARGPTIFTASDCLKLINFGGASIDGGENGSLCQWYCYRRSTPEVSKQTDVFAFGCVIYEIVTGRHPYHEFEASDNRSYLVEQLHQDNRFPDIANLPLGQLMQGCWHGTFNSVSEIIPALEAADSMTIKGTDGAAVPKILKSYLFFWLEVSARKNEWLGPAKFFRLDPPKRYGDCPYHRSGD